MINRLVAGLTMAAMALATAVAAEADQLVAFDHEFAAIAGGTLPLAQWRGKVPLVVNTASFCGYTPQYEGLQTFWERYEKRGLVVIGVPSNDFGGQEPNGESEILGFCNCLRRHLSAHDQAGGVGPRGTSLLPLDARGARACRRAALEFPQVFGWPRRPTHCPFDSRVTPLSAELTSSIERALGPQ